MHKDKEHRPFYGNRSEESRDPCGIVPCLMDYLLCKKGHIGFAFDDGCIFHGS